MIAISDLGPGAQNAPRTELTGLDFSAPTFGQACAYRTMLPFKDLPLDFLVLNKPSDILVVVLHGATDRNKYVLPRFEWLTTLAGTEYSSLHFGDPTILLRSDFQLGWFIGWPEIDLTSILARVVRSAVRQMGAKHLIITGASGGGFAALQLSARLKGSIAVPFNPQTQVSNYTVHGSYGVQRAFVQIVMPFLTDAEAFRDDSNDWSSPMGERLSCLRRYMLPVPNHVRYIQNRHDEHHHDEHYLPFVNVMRASGQANRLQVSLYEGTRTHNPPTADIYQREVDAAVAWSRKLTSVRV